MQCGGDNHPVLRVFMMLIQINAAMANQLGYFKTGDRGHPDDIRFFNQRNG